MGEGGYKSRKYIRRALLREWRQDREFVAAHDALEHEFTVAYAVIKARGDADKTQEVAKGMGTTQAVIARLESGETMPSTSN